LYKWSLRRCSRAAGEEDDAALAPRPLQAAENSVLKKGSLSGSTTRHEAVAFVEHRELSVVMAGAAWDRNSQIRGEGEGARAKTDEKEDEFLFCRV